MALALLVKLNRPVGAVGDDDIAGNLLHHRPHFSQQADGMVPGLIENLIHLLAESGVDDDFAGTVQV